MYKCLCKQNLHLQVVNARDGDVDASSLDPEETSPRDGEDDGVGEGDGNDREDDDDESDSYDPQHVTVPLTLCLFIMVG